jgi:hypothetical protein
VRKKREDNWGKIYEKTPKKTKKNNTHNKSSSLETRLGLVPVIERVVSLSLLALLVQKYKS